MKFFLASLLFLAAANWQDEVKQIDRQIESLQDLQDKLRSNATRNANKAMRWQFQNENYSDARRAWDQVAEDKQKIQELQDQIDDLKAKRKKILDAHGKKSPQ
jgi:DNA repair exonuclease SbcCD ATPase subunit